MKSKKAASDYVGIRRSLSGESLGELEAQIMDIVWDLEPPVTSAQVFKIMYPRRELSYSTIMLTMAKLSRKGILAQERSGTRKTDAFFYTPKVTREEMGAKLMDEVARRVLGKPLVEALEELTGGPVKANRFTELLKKADNALGK